MELDQTVCYRALKARDARFDGRFYTGVSSTGVYCRPVCPARTPLRRNCYFFSSAAAAAEGGYRPCLRCRPETSPGTPAWLGTSATVSRALRLICDGALVDAGINDLASRLGVGSRQLRRLFEQHLGASPVAVEQTRRVHFAKKLLDETDLPITQVAFSAGFNSIRRFNTALRGVYGRSPRDLRKRRVAAPSEPTIKLRLGYRPPFDWQQVTSFLQLRAIPRVEAVDEQAYVRTVACGEFRGTIRVAPGSGEYLVLEVSGDAAPVLPKLVAGVRTIFDLGADPMQIGEQLASDPVMRKLITKRPGVRVPGAWEPFELGVRAILGQQVTVRGATTLAGRLVERYGTEVASVDPSVDRLFPAPERLVDADIASLGMPRRRGETICNFAAAMIESPSLLDGSLGFDEAVDRLCAIPGIGPWTAQYVAMRALGAPDAFPASDLGLRKALAALTGEPVSAAFLAKRSESWRPWRAYAALLLWGSLSADRMTDLKGEIR